jgi:hypothetical protein
MIIEACQFYLSMLQQGKVWVRLQREAGNPLEGAEHSVPNPGARLAIYPCHLNDRGMAVYREE